MNILKECTIKQARHVVPGDKVCFDAPSANYIVDDVESTAIGMIRHHHGQGTASSSYWPNELLFVERK